MPQNLFNRDYIPYKSFLIDTSAELNFEIANIIDSLCVKLDTKSVFSSIIRALDKKMGHNRDVEDYLDSLIRDIGFFIECVDDYLLALAPLLSRNKCDPEFVDTELDCIQTKHKNSKEDFAKHKQAYQETWSSKGSTDLAEWRNDLEYQYGNYCVLSHLCLDFIGEIMGNPSIFKKMKKYRVEDIRKISYHYLDNCAHHLCIQLNQILSLREHQKKTGIRGRFKKFIFRV
jgi:hypothetical protein